MQPVLIFSLGLVPDVAGLRRLHALPDDLADAEVAEFAWQRQRAAGLGDCLAPALHRIVHLAALRHGDGGLTRHSLAGEEVEILHAFSGVLEGCRAAVEWSRPCGGSVLHGFAVLRLRALLAQISGLPSVPVMDLAAALAHPLPAVSVPLHEMARLAGLPWRGGADRATLWPEFLAGGAAAVEAANEARLLSAYQLWLRHALLQGELDQVACLQALGVLRQMLQGASDAHLQTYLADWSGLV